MKLEDMLFLIMVSAGVTVICFVGLAVGCLLWKDVFKKEKQ